MTELDKKLYRASARTFEDLAFVLPAELMDEECAATPLSRAVLVRFSGPFSGWLTLRVSSGVPPALAANMLGSCGEVPEAVQLDALKETANVLCGNFLPEIAGPGAVFRLEAPEAAGENSRSPSPSAAVQIPLENGRCEVSFYRCGET